MIPSKSKKQSPSQRHPDGEKYSTIFEFHFEFLTVERLSWVVVFLPSGALGTSFLPVDLSC